MSIKTLILSILLCNVTHWAFSQFESKTGNKWQVGFNINTVEPITEAGYDIYFGQTRLFNDLDYQKNRSLSLGVNIFRFIDEQHSLRLSTKWVNYEVEEIYDQRNYISASPPSSDYIIDTGYVKQSVFVFSPGILWHMPYKRLNFYGGLQFYYRKYSLANEHLIYRTYETQTDTLLSHRCYDIQLAGGFALGIAPCIGFSASIYKSISAGAEFSSVFSYYKTGGKFTWTQTQKYPNSIVDSYGTIHTYKAYKFSSLITSINLSYNF